METKQTHYFKIEKNQRLYKIEAGGILDGSGMILAYHPNQHVYAVGKKNVGQHNHSYEDSHENSASAQETHAFGEHAVVYGSMYYCSNQRLLAVQET